MFIFWQIFQYRVVVGLKNKKKKKKVVKLDCIDGRII